MPTNKNGKHFERVIKDDCQRQHIFCLRLNDSDVSYSNSSTTRFAPKNKADYICYYKGLLLPIECKSTKYKSFSIQRSESDNQSMIKAHQLKDLIELSEYDGVIPGFLFNFREEDENNNLIGDTTYWMYIKDMSNFLYDSDKNSINRLDIINYNGILVESKKLRKYFTYNIKSLFDGITNQDWLNS